MSAAGYYGGYPHTMQHMPADMQMLQAASAQGVLPPGVLDMAATQMRRGQAMNQQQAAMNQHMWAMGASTPQPYGLAVPQAHATAAKFLTIFPRRKAGQLKRASDNTVAVQLTLEMLHEIAHVPLIAAAKKLVPLRSSRLTRHLCLMRHVLRLWLLWLGILVLLQQLPGAQYLAPIRKGSTSIEACCEVRCWRWSSPVTSTAAQPLICFQTLAGFEWGPGDRRFSRAGARLVHLTIAPISRRASLRRR